MGDEAAQLAEAAKLSWEDRFAHKFWKARVAAYEGVVKEASISETIAAKRPPKRLRRLAVL